MPELPEVETIRRQLSAELSGKTIKNVEVRLAKMIKGQVFRFKKKITGAGITSVSRRAKILIFSLSNGYAILVHLKMTGQLVYTKQGKIKTGGHPIKDGHKDLPNKFTHVIFKLNGRATLFFNDIRQFGYLMLVKAGELDGHFSRMRIGPEPLKSDFTLGAFTKLLLKKKKSKIKPLLMDQSFIAGVGNIYATEACYYSKIRPTRRVGSLKKDEISKLYLHLIKILKFAIKKQGTSAKNYIDAFGEPGEY
ncbi:bifunctional DNA-formamidopyrimidine glycosylase/DNA-(apurinic or apyrimidinic site) lyase, partial [Patescibacteria group bacterium]|nr:bifunctional DNA-formamidopyrimidine glycosylase/DNA-(apurinic or apyrimidinic site) lyase [Patescibacteria group bacterium]